MRARASVLAAIVMTAACGGDGAARHTEATVRDSAGIHVVENVDPVWGADEGWAVAAEPRVVIGAMDGAEAYQFFQIRGVRRLGDGRFAVMNGGTAELRFYSASGDHELTVGGPGEGPGEFRYVVGMYPWPGDSLVVFDIQLCRMSVFSSAGVFGRTLRLPRPDVRAPCFWVRGVLGDGTLLGSSMVPSQGQPIGRVTQGTPVPLLRWHPDADRFDTLAMTSSSSTVTMEEAGRRMTIPLPYDGAPAVDVGPTSVFYGFSGTYEIRKYDVEGTLQAMVRRAVTPTAVTEVHIDRAMDTVTGFSYLRDDWVRIRRGDVPFAETLPAFGTVLSDDLGYLLVQDYVPPGESAMTWSVFDSTGIWLGTVATPDGVRLWQLGEDFLLGTWSDEFDVEYVGLWELRRQAQER